MALKYEYDKLWGNADTFIPIFYADNLGFAAAI